MITALISSSITFVILISLYTFESIRGVRIFDSFRTWLDKITDIVIKKTLSAVVGFFEFIHKDVVLYLLHLVTYIALLLLRFAEFKLERVIYFLKSFRRKKNNKGISSKLKTITKLGDSD